MKNSILKTYRGEELANIELAGEDPVIGSNQSIEYFDTECEMLASVAFTLHDEARKAGILTGANWAQIGRRRIELWDSLEKLFVWAYEIEAAPVSRVRFAELADIAFEFNL